MPSQTAWQQAVAQLEKHLDDFQSREPQQQMADAVEAAILRGHNLICEAPTGTGKTYAYLLPLLFHDQKAIISTGTKTLQDQLYRVDIPRVTPFLGRGKRFAVLKGRANYLCRYRLESTYSESMTFDKVALRQLKHVMDFAEYTKSGDLSECHKLPEDASIWPYVTSTVDNCLGQDCPMIGQCHLLKARKKAMDADVVVVNHHLLFADQLLKEDGLGELLPEVDTIVLDEAHQVPEIAALFFTKTVSSKQVVNLVQDTLIEQAQEAKDMLGLRESGERCQAAVTASREGIDAEVSTRGAWRELAACQGFTDGIETLDEALADFVQQLEQAEARSPGLANCFQRAKSLQSDFRALTKAHDSDGQSKAESVHWFELFKRSFHIHKTPLSIRDSFSALLREQKNNWIFTSATLSTDRDFSFFRQEMGLDEDTAELQLESPFDFTSQARFYVPRGLPDPRSQDFTEQCVQAALPLIESLQGRTFFLFTSHRALQQAAKSLKAKTSFPLFVQGESTRSRLLEEFRFSGNGVLLGTSSFWEGIDIRGEALSGVIIDKLPFASPGDPVAKARIDAYRRQHGDPFAEYQLPKAVIMLKQGAGRLIRDIADRGVLMVCDPRIVSKPYGGVFLRSLPTFKRSRDFALVEAFIENWV